MGPEKLTLFSPKMDNGVEGLPPETAALSVSKIQCTKATDNKQLGKCNHLWAQSRLLDVDFYWGDIAITVSAPVGLMQEIN